MKRDALLVVLLCVCVCGSAVFGTRAGTQPSAINSADEESRVKKVLDSFFEAARKRDWDAAGRLMSEDFEIYTDDASSFNKPAYVELLKKDDLELKDMKLREQEVRVSGDGNMAWTKYRGFFRCISHGKAYAVETAETLIFQKDGEEWKIVRAHASVKEVKSSAEKL